MEIKRIGGSQREEFSGVLGIREGCWVLASTIFFLNSWIIISSVYFQTKKNIDDLGFSVVLIGYPFFAMDRRPILYGKSILSRDAVEKQGSYLLVATGVRKG